MHFLKKLHTNWHPAVKIGVPAWQCVNPGERQVWTICCHVKLTETAGRGGEQQTDNEYTVSAQKQQLQRRKVEFNWTTPHPPTPDNANMVKLIGMNAQFRRWTVSCALYIVCHGLALFCGIQGLVAEKQHLVPLLLSAHLIGEESPSGSFSQHSRPCLCVDRTVCSLLNAPSRPSSVVRSSTGWHSDALTGPLPTKTRLPRSLVGNVVLSELNLSVS